MFIRTVWSALIRRWRLTIVGVLITFVLCIVALNVVPPTYEARALLVLLPPNTSVASSGGST